jgi:hypothetical protein
MKQPLTNSFLRLAPPGSTQILAKWINGKVDLESVSCPLNPNHQRPGKRLTPLYLTAPQTSQMLDFLWTWPSELLVHSSLLAVFRDLGFSGYETRRAYIRFGDSSTYDVSFSELVVTGWGGIATPDSGVQRTFRCPACHHTVYSCFTQPERLIDPKNWDGADFFLVWPMPRYIFVSARVAQEFRKRKWSGASLEELPQLSCKGSLTPGELDFYMPEARAAEIRSSIPSSEL